jgi:ACS family hexuronate transporter-like MFS transporter
MPVVVPDVRLSPRGSVWKWWVCGLLLLATMINYMDRLTVNLTADRIIKEFDLNKTQYGLIESVFAIAFAVGALGSGWLADRYNVRWLYPGAVLLWSVAGFATGFSRTLAELMLFRFLLGLFESGNWPSALRTTQRILPPHERTLGNAILQSGASLGAVLTPLVVLFFLTQTNSWRPPFLAVGAVGVVWVFLWLSSVRTADLALPDWEKEAKEDPGLRATHASLGTIILDRHFWVLAVLVVALNAAWHFFRVWLPLFLREVHGYTDAEMNWFASAYYLSADAGALSAGAATLWLARRGLTVHRSRVVVFLSCALLTTLSIAAAFLPRGPLLLGLFLLIGFGSLGVFPQYYSFSQELTVRHQGKLTGTLGCISWMAQALLQWLAGVSIDATKSYTLGVAVAGFLPISAWLVLVLFWKRGDTPGMPVPAEEPIEKDKKELEAIRDVDDRLQKPGAEESSIRS